MPASDTNLAEHSGNLVESYKGYDPRIVAFYFFLAALLLTLAGGLAYRQLIQSDTYNERERIQSQRRVLIPGPRGNIYARDGTTVLVGNRAHFSVVLYLAELKSEFLRESDVIRRNYRKSGITNVSFSTYSKIARISVVQRYLDQVNQILGRTETVDEKSLARHFSERLQLPYTLIDDLTPNEFARLTENLPVRSPLQVFTSSMRHYPYGSTAAHALGYIRSKDEAVPEDFPGEDLQIFKMPGTEGKAGLEKTFDSELRGEPGGMVFRVDHAGYKINPPLEKHLPVQGKHIISSLDIDLQLAGEQALVDTVGAAVALDVNTGEVLALVSKPDYNPADFYPRLDPEKYAKIQAQYGEINRAVYGSDPPGSTFKILTTIAALRHGAINPTTPIIDCDGTFIKNNRRYVCFNGLGHHHNVLLPEAIAHSCDIYYYEVGWRTTPDAIAAEARRFGFGQKTGIELPTEQALHVPDTEWKERVKKEKWFPGDTANMAIGQGFVEATPIQMACFIASFARGETITKPTMIHEENRPRQKTEPIGLTTEQRLAMLDGMEGVIHYGSAKFLNTIKDLLPPGIRIAGKTGTAQKVATINGETGKINFAWFICFAPAEKPEIAIAVKLEGDTIGEEYGGGRNAAPVAAKILKTYFAKKNRSATDAFTPRKTE